MKNLISNAQIQGIVLFHKEKDISFILLFQEGKREGLSAEWGKKGLSAEC
jgi:hypothetical protein